MGPLSCNLTIGLFTSSVERVLLICQALTYDWIYLIIWDLFFWLCRYFVLPVKIILSSSLCSPLRGPKLVNRFRSPGNVIRSLIYTAIFYNVSLVSNGAL